MPHGQTADLSTAITPTQSGVEQGPQFVPALTVITHPMPQRVGDRAIFDALLAGRTAELSRNTPDFTQPGHALGQPLADPFVSRIPLRVSLGAGNTLRLHVPKEGTRVTLAGAPVTGDCELPLEALHEGVPLILSNRITLLLHLTEAGAREATDALGMVGGGAGIRQVREHILRIADLNVPVLIRGETGTGKELVAQAIHRRSAGSGRPFISVNLGAIPKELAAAELFGAQRGAYTGADRGRDGFFRVAQGGTLFLDEVGEAPPEVQVMLLRVLETGEMFPVGGHTPVKTQVRLIAATDAHLEEQIRDGRFKAPLLHRLAGYEIRLPALRERREDIGVLFHHFALEELKALGEADRLAPRDPHAEAWVPASLAMRLLRFNWPGNIRQLRNIARQLVIGSRGLPALRIDPKLAHELDTAAAPLPVRVPITPSVSAARPASRRKPSEVSEAELLAALREHAWDLKAAADRLEIPRSSIYDVIDRCPNIRTAGDVSAEEIVRCFQECHGDLDAMAQRLEVSKRALKRRTKELGLRLTDD